MIMPWDYIDTELPYTDPNRSGHMRNMGKMGWELVSVSSNPTTAGYVFFANGHCKTAKKYPVHPAQSTQIFQARLLKSLW